MSLDDVEVIVVDVKVRVESVDVVVTDVFVDCVLVDEVVVVGQLSHATGHKICETSVAQSATLHAPESSNPRHVRCVVVVVEVRVVV